MNLTRVIRCFIGLFAILEIIQSGKIRLSTTVKYAHIDKYNPWYKYIDVYSITIMSRRSNKCVKYECYDGSTTAFTKISNYLCNIELDEEVRMYLNNNNINSKHIGWNEYHRVIGNISCLE